MRRIIAFSLVIVMICNILTGCRAKEKESVTINIKLPLLTLPAVNDPECTETSYFMQKAFDSFAAQYDKYDVSANIQVFEQTKYQENIVDCYGREDGADLMLGGYFAISGLYV